MAKTARADVSPEPKHVKAAVLALILLSECMVIRTKTRPKVSSTWETNLKREAATTREGLLPRHLPTNAQQWPPPRRMKMKMKMKMM